MDQVVSHPRRARALAAVLVAAALTWWVYVPVHELLHAAGCVSTGGTVGELQVKRIYGGAILARVFPFVVSGGDYAGRLSGFDTGGSDLVYLATDFLPFTLSIVIGVPLLRWSLRRRSPATFGASVVLALAPLLSVTGDYYEMGSILVGRAALLVGGASAATVAQAIRSDDVVVLAADLFARRAELGLLTPGALPASALLVVVSAVLGLILALATYAAGATVSRLLIGDRPGAVETR